MKLLKKILGRKEPSRVVVLIDFENLLLSIENRSSPVEKEFSVGAGFHAAIRKIAQEIGEVTHIFVFVPPHAANLWGKLFQQERFTIVFCPKIINKEGQEVDTVDPTIIDFGKWAIANIQGLTHLCIGSGDKDFQPLVKEAVMKGLEIIVIFSSEKSLSRELRKLADKTYYFSPVPAGVPAGSQ